MSRNHRRPAVGACITAMLLCMSVTMPQTVFAEPATAWVDESLTPWLVRQLTSHPRFKGEPVRVAAFDGENEDATPNLLSARLVSRVENRLAQENGVRLAWRPPSPDWSAAVPSLRPSCRPREDVYVIAIESGLMADPAGAFIRVRILDVRDRQWVPGAVREWQGRPDAGDRVQLVSETRRDEFAGNRDLPFESGQEDLMAARAAESLACGLLAHPAEDLRLWYAVGDSESAEQKVARLVPQYLARAGLLRLSTVESEANLVLTVESQALDPATRQLWVILEPAAADPDLPSVRTSLYASDRTGMPPRVAERPSVEQKERPGPVTAVMRPGDCRSRKCRASGRSAEPVVEVGIRGLQHVELLAVTEGGGLVRLDSSGCEEVPVENIPDAIKVRPEATGRELVALFIVAATSVAAADDLAGEFVSFPGACRSAGLRAAAARGRLVTLQRRLSRFGGEIQWTRVGLTGPASRMEFADTGPF
jgi:hypothetical protein